MPLTDDLPASFRFGAATSAYQIEGAVAEDGRTPSIWDTFCGTPGAVANGDTGQVACDHYHRWRSDVALMRELSLSAYRFSIGWPRVQPGGRGPANPAGIAFYDRLVDELLAAGVEPWATLYHWDLPQELEDAGGWPARDTAYRFADCAGLVVDALGDRVTHWNTVNEPWCSVNLGYIDGTHAPGRRDRAAGMAAAHHLLLGHGLATARIRATGHPAQVGPVFILGTATPYSDSEADAQAARRADGLGARFYLDAVAHGRYPADVLADLAADGIDLPVRDGDLATISTPIDMLGVNYYFSQLFSGVNEHGDTHDEAGRPVVRGIPRGRPVTALGWEIVPDQLTELLLRLHRDYPGLPLVVTENGAAFADRPDDQGHVADQDRIDYLAAHLDAVRAACARGADVRGFFVWSLLDNFEWAQGYGPRFGLVRVDYPTQRRIPKRSALWYRDLIRAHRAATGPESS